jgi:hypothetical protein
MRRDRVRRILGCTTRSSASFFVKLLRSSSRANAAGVIHPFAPRPAYSAARLVNIWLATLHHLLAALHLPLPASSAARLVSAAGRQFLHRSIERLVIPPRLVPFQSPDTSLSWCQ